ncbi:MAG: biotin--[acetyl-CoA-carboxylase] ligase [Lentisphaerae bacterium]|nr:biotin--[acetyl-CoA-carboxylase] ligase [Lentisphaerota bacterium]
MGIPYRWLATAESTNDVAREWALAGAPHGAVVTAARQTRGRGRRERVWESPAGTGLYASFILRPGWPAVRAPDLAILSGMAAYGAMERGGVKNLRVKWPNDILANGRKICGVLVEPRIGEGRIEFAVAGIGINIHQTSEDFPPAFRSAATSCAMEGLRAPVDRWMNHLVSSMEAVGAIPFEEVRAAWIAAGAREEEPEL